MDWDWDWEMGWGLGIGIGIRDRDVVAKSHHLNEQTLVYLIAAVLALILAIFNSYSEQV